MPVSEPFEFWDWPSGETREILVEDWEEGEHIIQPRYPGAPARKSVQVLRLHLKEGVKETLPYYWDVTAKTLIPYLKAYLERGEHKTKAFIITKHGTAPRARFSLSVRNLD